MELIDILVIVSAVVAALTKILDVVSTIKYVPINCESNAIARWLFRKFGKMGVCWATFVFEAIIIALVTVPIVISGSLIEKIALIVISLLIILPMNISTWLLNAKGISTIYSRFGIWINHAVGRILRKL